jgi:hypothetical protein
MFESGSRRLPVCGFLFIRHGRSKWRRSCKVRPGRARRIISWLRETWAEMEYAQRRMIELNMVVPPPRVSADPSGVDKLEAIYSLPARAGPSPRITGGRGVAEGRDAIDPATPGGHVTGRS